jgi:hypothetical protein
LSGPPLYGAVRINSDYPLVVPEMILDDASSPTPSFTAPKAAKAGRHTALVAGR